MAFSNIPTSGLWSTISSLINLNSTNSQQQTGWAQYEDTQYTDVAPFSVVGNVDTILPNNSGNIIDSQMPSDIPAMYSGGLITGRNGDGLAVTIDLTATPTNVGTTTLEIWLDIGAPVGELYRRILTFPKGNGVARGINFTVVGYTLGTWQTNGATVYVRSNGDIDLHSIRYVLTRTHKAA